MPVKTPRKKAEEVQHLEGWNFHEMKTNLYSPCKTCSVKANEFFYRHVRPEPGAGILITEVRCLDCAKKIIDKTQ